MISIDEAIIKSKTMENVSNGGSACFDFGDVVLVKYVGLVDSSRECEDRVMEGANLKADQGVNTPRHLEIKRVQEGINQICYVLQEKCKGTNCAAMHKSNASYDEVIDSCKYALNIPFSHYRKLISDGCSLFNMGHEAKPKNVFYDEETGFWFIDLLDYDKEHPFDPNNPELLKIALMIMPSPLILTSYIDTFSLSGDEKNQLNELYNAILGKTFLAYKTEFPIVEKYEKFILSDSSDDYKKYLMDSGIVKKDLFNLNQEDYVIFDQFYNIIIDRIVDEVNNGVSFANIQCNDTDNISDHLGVRKIWKIHKDNPIKPSDFSSDYEYNHEIYWTFKRKLLTDIAKRLRELEKTENIDRYLSEFELWNSRFKVEEPEKKEQEQNTNNNDSADIFGSWGNLESFDDFNGPKFL